MLNTREVTKNYRLNQWTALIRECRNSGQTVIEWCANHDINTRNYYYWLNQVRIAACEALPSMKNGGESIVPIDIPKPKSSEDSKKQQSSSDIILRFGEITLELSNSASASLIENTLRVIQNAR